MVEPNRWKVQHYANVGFSEELVSYLAGEVQDLIDASIIFDPEMQALKVAIMTILMGGLLPAFEHLKKIRASVGAEMPMLNRAQLYEDFSRVLWHRGLAHPFALFVSSLMTCFTKRPGTSFTLFALAGGPSFRAFCERVGIPETEQLQSEFLLSPMCRQSLPVS